MVNSVQFALIFIYGGIYGGVDKTESIPPRRLIKFLRNISLLLFVFIFFFTPPPDNNDCASEVTACFAIDCIFVPDDKWCIIFSTIFANHGDMCFNVFKTLGPTLLTIRYINIILINCRKNLTLPMSSFHFFLQISDV